MRIYFENANSLPITYKAWKISYKYCRLKYLWKRLKVNVITLKETQINTSLIDRLSSISENLFRHKNHFIIMSNNNRELIRSRYQGGVLSLIKGECTNLV